VQAVLPGVVGHRLRLRDDGDTRSANDIGLAVLKAVAVP